jgi:predicted translin family RNA/ssDNA-binding protein
MTIKQLREALDFMESNYEMAMDFKAYSLAEALRDKILILQNQLVEAIVAEDPYTSEADVRFFEDFRVQ